MSNEVKVLRNEQEITIEGQWHNISHIVDGLERDGWKVTVKNTDGHFTTVELRK